MNVPPSITIIDYIAELAKANCHSSDELQTWFQKELPYVFYETYLKFTPRRTEVVLFTHGSFSYIFDDCSVIAQTATDETEKSAEPRLVVAFGLSNPQKKKRDDYRLKGWLGSTEKVFGKDYDKGHFIANSIGGAVDGVEVNVFFQKRDVNRGWNNNGIYRKMEKYCMDNPETPCFNRPIYTDNTAYPKYIEFGLFKNKKDLWVEVFEN